MVSGGIYLLFLTHGVLLGFSSSQPQIIIMPPNSAYICTDQQTTLQHETQQALQKQIFLAMGEAVIPFNKGHRGRKLKVYDRMFPGCKFNNRIAEFYRSTQSFGINSEDSDAEMAAKYYLENILEMTTSHAVLWVSHPRLLIDRDRSVEITVYGYRKMGFLFTGTITLQYEASSRGFQRQSLSAFTGLVLVMIREIFEEKEQ